MIMRTGAHLMIYEQRTGMDAEVSAQSGGVVEAESLKRSIKSFVSL